MGSPLLKSYSTSPCLKRSHLPQRSTCSEQCKAAAAAAEVAPSVRQGLICVAHVQRMQVSWVPGRRACWPAPRRAACYPHHVWHTMSTLWCCPVTVLAPHLQERDSCHSASPIEAPPQRLVLCGRQLDGPLIPQHHQEATQLQSSGAHRVKARLL